MVLVVVLWIVLGLVAVVLLFTEGMRMEYKASANSTASIEAGQALEGARRYAAYVLGTLTTPGVIPTSDLYEAENVPIGDASFWIIGRADEDLWETTSGVSGTGSDLLGTGSDFLGAGSGASGASSGMSGMGNSLSQETPPEDTPVFCFVDEAAKLNINTATRDMIELLPNMTTDVAAAIMDWRNSPNDPQPDGAESSVYLAGDPAYECKNASFESVEELRLVKGVTQELLYGADTNRNGILDPDEADQTSYGGDVWRGLLDYVTVFTREPNRQPDGGARIDVRISPTSTDLDALLDRHLGTGRTAKIEAAVQPVAKGIRSVLEYYEIAGLTATEAAPLEDKLTANDGAFILGRVNVNTAPREVLLCLPGIGEKYADQLIEARQGKNTEQLASVAWVMDILDRQSAVEAGPYITTRSFQIGADIVAVAKGGRVMRRSWMVFDTSGSAPVVIYRTDQTHLGWPLGAALRGDLDLGLTQTGETENATGLVGNATTRTAP